MAIASTFDKSDIFQAVKLLQIIISDVAENNNRTQQGRIKMLKSPFGLLHYDWFTDCETPPTNVNKLHALITLWIIYTNKSLMTR